MNVLRRVAEPSVFALLLCIPLPGPAGAETPARAVRVLDLHGEPVPGARVRCLSPPAVPRLADGAGIAPVPGECAIIECDAPGYLPAEGRPGPGAQAPASCVLQPALTLVVHGPADAALEAVRVRAFPFAGAPPAGETPRAAVGFVADAGGQSPPAARLGDLPPGRYLLEARRASDGWRCWTEIGPRGPGRVELQAGWREPLAVAGVVVDGSGEPLPGIPVRAHEGPADRPPAELASNPPQAGAWRCEPSAPASGETDQRGRFSLVVDPGRDSMIVAGSWESPGGVDARIVGGPLDPVRLAPQPPAILLATLLHENERPARCRAELTTDDPAAWWLTRVLGGASRSSCDEDGRIRLGPFRAGDVGVRIFPARGLPLIEHPPPPAPGETVDLGVLRVPAGERVAVTVADESGAPVEGAEVLARARSAIILHVEGETDANGRAELAGLPSGSRIVLTVSAPGFLDEQRDALTVEDFPLEIPLQPAAVLSGEVVDPWHRPIAGAEVTVRAGGRPRVAGTTTGDAGMFRIDDAPEGVLHLSAAAPGYRTREELEVELAAGESRAGLVLELEPRPELRGRVLDQAGDPVAGAEVSLIDHWALDWLESSRAHAVALTGPDGRFSLPRMETGGAIVLARASGHGAAVDRAPFSHGETELELTLPEAAAARVHLPANVEGDAVVQLVDGLGLGHVRRVTPSGGVAASPGVRFDDLAPGDARARLVPGPVARARLDAGAEAEIWLEAGAFVEGRVVRDGAPVPRAVVNAARLLEGAVRFGQLRHSDGDGGFRFEGLDPGRYLIVVESEAGRGEHPVQLTAGEHRQITVELERVALHLLVRDAESGQPLAGARARLRWAGFEGKPSSHGFVAFPRGELGFDMVVNNYGGDEESTGSSGIAVLVVPREGEFVLSVRRSGHEPFEEPLTLPRGNSRREVELEPAPQPSLRVTLLSDPPGRSGRVLLYGDDLQARRYTAHEALFEDVPPGSYHVVFVVDGLGAAHDTVVVGESGETALALRLRRGGTLLVPVAGPGASRPRVVDAAGVDWDRIFRRLELPGQEIAQLEERPGIGPAWIFPALPPGTYTVSVEGVSRQPVRIEPGSVQTAW